MNAEGYPISWDFISLACVDQPFQPLVQKDLTTSLLICSKSAASQGFVRSPKLPLHAGINLLDKLLKQPGEKVPELHLLRSLELFRINDFRSGNESLDKYHELVLEGKDKHPLFLLALARSDEKWDGFEQFRQKYLIKFSQFYPGAVEVWFSESEKSALSNSSSNEKESEKESFDDILTRWETLKLTKNVRSESMKKLMKLVGLKNFKNDVIDLFEFALKIEQLDPEVKRANPIMFNYCFVGNGGTGKTVAADLLSGVLKDAGIRPAETTSGKISVQELKEMGPMKFRDLADSSAGGVLVIDDAHELDPKHDCKGGAIVTELLAVAENHRDRLSIILTGNRSEMEEKLFSFKKGFESRFHIVSFEDFDAKDLEIIWKKEIENRKFTCDDRVTKVVTSKLAKFVGTKGFENARAVRVQADKAVTKAIARKDFYPNKMEITICDVIGENPLTNPKVKSVLAEINSKIGWIAVKKSVQELIALCQTNYERIHSGLEALPVHLNRPIVGNPGTGKTTFARLYGQLLRHLNLLSNGETIEISGSDLIGTVVGESQKKATDILERSKGKILFIDEAYQLDDGHFGKQVLDVFVAKVQNADDCVILLAGYEEKMRKMLQDTNPGLSRRFPMNSAFRFEDYNDEELLEIVNLYCQKNNYSMSSYKVGERILKTLNKQKVQANFGNAGSVENLIKSAAIKASTRPPPTLGSIEIRPEDIVDDEGDQDEESDPLSALDSLYKMDDIREQLTELRNSFQVAKYDGDETPEIGHFVFRGSPGTGKTTVARKLAKILHRLGVLARDHLEETTGLNLTGEYCGQTKKRVYDTLDKARGGVLFIDEAYAVARSIHFGEEAISTLVASMTDPQYSGIVIIIAGYAKDMEKMLSVNEGLKSRFNRFCDFPDWTSEDCSNFIRDKAEKESFLLDEDGAMLLPQGFDNLICCSGWGNARDAKQLWDSIKSKRANRVVVNKSEDVKSIKRIDVERAIDKMITSRQSRLSRAEIDWTMRSCLTDSNLPQVQHQQTVSESSEEEREEMYETGQEEYFEELQAVSKHKMGEQTYSEKESFEESEPENSEKHSFESLEEDLEEMWETVGEEMRQSVVNERMRLHEEERQEKERLRLQEEERQRKERLKLQEEERQRKEKERLRLQEEGRRKEKEILRLQEEERRRKEKERLRLQEEERRRKEWMRLLEEERQKEEKERLRMQEELQRLMPCPQGYAWKREGLGWRCEGGSHYVSDEELRSKYSY